VASLNGPNGRSNIFGRRRQSHVWLAGGTSLHGVTSKRRIISFIENQRPFSSGASVQRQAEHCRFCKLGGIVCRLHLSEWLKHWFGGGF
jgi:hypothetical protein